MARAAALPPSRSSPTLPLLPLLLLLLRETGEKPQTPTPRADPVPSPPFEWGEPEHLPRSTPSSPSPLSRALFLAGPYRLRPFPLCSPLPSSPFFTTPPAYTGLLGYPLPLPLILTPKGLNPSLRDLLPTSHRAVNRIWGSVSAYPLRHVGNFCSLPQREGRDEETRPSPHFPSSRAGRLRPWEN